MGPRKKVKEVGRESSSQAWIYEYFPCFWPQRNSLAVSDQDPRCRKWDYHIVSKNPVRLNSIRRRLDTLQASEWMARHFDCTRDLLEDRYNDQRPNTSMCYEMMD
ncbi:hypothetical protein BVRB_1g009960 isoform B [Beta vulgaris subsp. vulgaris]|uniref:uncharacterized protein LOC104892975 n=1 Tax=Beta vulgaris subsp. vulgaris TaxID=3555 RepID=UPI000540218D|nr:uncharacterized protein LOC104892975 [Beta vulgaris subsp. vulgaris]KMT19952.1 hypothetical protein BVRB_1g009960 isoform B [Beta vulgaris subsp. vulgaris]